MSLWKFNDFEREVDFTDADFLDRLEDAKKNMNDQLRLVPKTGKNSDIIRSQVACYRVFYDTLFGEGAGDAIMGGKTSLNICLEATAVSYTHLDVYKRQWRTGFWLSTGTGSNI